MFRSYLAAALRNLRNNKLYAGIMIIGLAVGFAAALLIGLFVRNEFSYDYFLPGANRIYLLSTAANFIDDASPPEIASWLKLDFPTIEEVARLDPTQLGVRHGDVEGIETVYWADPNFFSIFQLPVVAGDLSTALQLPTGIVITRSMAEKYFGRADPIGEILDLDRNIPMQVTAVIEDLPSNTHLKTQIIAAGGATKSPLTRFDAAPPSSAEGSINTIVYTYLRLKSGTTGESLQSAMPAFITRHMSLKPGEKLAFTLIPVEQIHLSPPALSAMKPHGDRPTLYVVAAIGALAVIVASINFINLMTARATRRAVEVGVRKALGARRWDLIVQFIGEAMISVAISMMIAVGLVELALPDFNAFMDRSIRFDLWRDSGLDGAVLALALLIGIAAGAYPALILSAIRPAAVLKAGGFGVRGSVRLREGLVIIQFAILIGLFLATEVIYLQTNYATRDSLRLDKDQVLVVRGACSRDREDRFKAVQGVMDASCSWSAPFNFSVWNSWATLPDGTRSNLRNTSVDFGFFELYGLKPVAGRFFSPDHQTDAVPAGDKEVMAAPLVINETAVRKLGFRSPEAAIGQHLSLEEVRDVTQPSEIIGVVADFPVDSIRQPIDPTAFYVDPDRFGLLSLKLDRTQLPETLSAIDGIWKELDNRRPIQRFFVTDLLDKLYIDVAREAKIFAGFAFIALFIGSLGLFGLSAFNAERRTKEIGIRKALGASRNAIVRMLVWEFTKPVLWSNLLAWPISYFLLQRWLEGFAYHIDLQPAIFLLATSSALLIAWATVTTHAVVVAGANPISALRYE
jgi:putative ABC transport system permease protein